jgi:hypothetical protein
VLQGGGGGGQPISVDHDEMTGLAGQARQLRATVAELADVPSPGGDLGGAELSEALEELLDAVGTRFEEIAGYVGGAENFLHGAAAAMYEADHRLAGGPARFI